MDKLTEELFGLYAERLAKEEKWCELESVLHDASVYLNVPQGEKFYTVALLFLNQCRDSFDGNLYKKAIDFLLVAFEENDQKNDVWHLLEQIVWNDNMPEMKKISTWMANRQAPLLWQKMKDSYGASEGICLKEIQQYHRLRPNCEKYHWLMGVYYLQKKEYLLAKQMVRRGLKKRAISFDLRCLEAQIEVALGNYEAAIGAYAFALKAGKTDVRIAAIQKLMQECLLTLKAVSEERLQQGLCQMERVMADGRKSPWKYTFTFNEQNQLSYQDGTYANEYLDHDADGWGFFVGLYNEESEVNIQAERIKLLKSVNAQSSWYVDDVYDYVKAKPVEALTCEGKNVPYLLPLIAHASMQKMDFAFAGKEASL